MKTYKRIVTALLALAMMLSFSGCLAPKDNEADDAAPGSATAAPADASDFNPEAVAIELGDIKITAGEINESYNYYMSMLENYYGSVPTDDASIKEYRDMAISELIGYHVAEWKAKSLGVSLDADREAAIEAEADEEIESMRNSFIVDYAVYYAGASEDVEDVSELTQEQIDAALQQIADEITQYLGADYTFDRYLAEQHSTLVNDRRVQALTDALKQSQFADFTLTDAQTDAWYEETLKKQQEAFDADPLSYRTQLSDYLSGTNDEPVLYLPEGFVKVRLISIAPESERDLKADENRAKMAELEQEYGALALNESDSPRQEMIRMEYAALKAENERLEEAYLGTARDLINEAYEALEEEMSFEDVMKIYNANGPEEAMLYVADADTAYGELCDYAKDLPVGTYSEPLLIDDVYYIIMRVETPKAGAVDRAEIEEEIRTAATAATLETEWSALYGEWEKEAEQTAVRHEETYAAVGYMDR